MAENLHLIHKEVTASGGDCLGKTLARLTSGHQESTMAKPEKLRKMEIVLALSQPVKISYPNTKKIST